MIPVETAGVKKQDTYIFFSFSLDSPFLLNLYSPACLRKPGRSEGCEIRRAIGLWDEEFIN